MSTIIIIRKNPDQTTGGQAEEPVVDQTFDESQYERARYAIDQLIAERDSKK